MKKSNKVHKDSIETMIEMSPDRATINHFDDEMANAT